LPPLATVTVSDSSDTYRRIGPDSEKLPRALRFFAAQLCPPGGERCRGCCSPLDTECNLPWLNRDIPPHFSFLTTIVRQAPPVNPVEGPSRRPARRRRRQRNRPQCGKPWAMRCASAQRELIGVVIRAANRVRLDLYGSWRAPRSPRGIYGGSVCVAHGSATEASWGRTAPDVRGGRANGARPS
jgi:hypothetical protein